MSEVVQFGVEAVSTQKKVGSFGSERSEARITRLTAFFALAENQRWVKLGNLIQLDHAATLANGNTIVMPDTLTADGIKLSLVPGQLIGLSNIKEWGCPACGSAHGSGVYPSREVSAKNLAKCQWFYNPVTKRIFTMSDSCLETYFPGGSKSKRLIYAAELQPAKQQETTKK